MSEDVEFEYEIKTYAVDENLLKTVTEDLQAGWQVVQGVKPVAIYHMVRPRQKPQEGGGMGAIRIDDSKVYIIRANGNIENYKGEVVPKVPE